MVFTRPQPPAARTDGHVPVPWRRYVALGDSFTEGLWDLPEGTPEDAAHETACRGWADLLAAHLAVRASAAPPADGGAGDGGAGDGGAADHPADPVTYANLAVRGRTLRPILQDQVPAARALGPDLVSIIGGGNDLLRPNGDPDRMAAALERAVEGFRAAGTDVLLGTGMDAKDSPLVRHSRGRVAVFNAHIWSIARRHGAHVVDLWGMRSLRDWRMWSEDRIHLTGEGHRRVAQAALVALGLEPDDPDWDDPLTPLPPVPRTVRVREDVEWVRTHVYPWATRRLRGQSSGDHRSPKRPELRPVELG